MSTHHIADLALGPGGVHPEFDRPVPGGVGRTVLLGASVLANFLLGASYFD